MVTGSAWRKSNLRQIRMSLGRYLAILAIVALGIGFFALIMLLPYFILTYTLIFAVSDGIQISFSIFRSVFTRAPAQIKLTKHYVCRFSRYAAFCAVSSLADAVLSACFINFFSF